MSGVGVSKVQFSKMGCFVLPSQLLESGLTSFNAQSFQSSASSMS